MAKEFIFYDHYELVSRPTAEDVKDIEFEDATGNTQLKKGLRVELEATHAGYVNKNSRFYLPAMMKEGLKTWTTDRPRPAKILKHHDSGEDPIGVIRDAVYVDTVPKDLEKDSDIQILLDKKADHLERVDAVNRFIATGKPFKKDWQGLGYTKLIADIYDEDAIEKILDGRLDAVSTSFGTNKAICTVCQADAYQTWCGHRPGKWYDPPEDEDTEDASKRKKNKLLCMFIPERHINRECSFVNFEGDPLVKVAVKEDGEEIDLPEGWAEAELDQNELEAIFSDSEQDSSEDQSEEESISLDDESASDPNEDEEVNADEIYEEMIKELEQMVEDGEMTQEELEDAKLSTAARKKLPDSAFCGPGRSFPVNDCPHYTAALRLLNRYKGPGDKSKIKTCINRKGKAMGCSGAKKYNEVESTEQTLVKFEVPTCEALKDLKEDELRELFQLSESEMIDRNFKVQTECGQCAEFSSRTDKAEKDLEDLQEANKDQEDTIRVLRQEVKFYSDDYGRQVDQYITLGTELEEAKLKYFATLSVLQGKHKDLKEATEALRESDLSIDGVVLEDSFDLSKLYAKLNDGMTREPEGTVENPGINIDTDNTLLPESMDSKAKAAIKRIKTTFKKNQESAYQLYDRLRKTGTLTDEITFDDIVGSLRAADEEV